MHLQHLRLTGFRGIGSELDIDLGHRTLIFGPNGSGKSSILQAIPWTIYGKLPFLTGSVFTREDALVNDFQETGQAETTVTLSDGTVITRSRGKQTSTSRGKNPLVFAPSMEDPQAAVEQLIDLNSEEFFASVFLHQETIREFITTTPDKRSATIDRMLGTYLLRTLVKVIDPSIPADAIEEAQQQIAQVDRELAQASVISLDLIQRRKAEHGDPDQLQAHLEHIQQDLTPLAARFGLGIPSATLAELENGLAAIRKAQIDTISSLESRAAQLSMLRERYQQAAVDNWQSVRQRRIQYGDPATLDNILVDIHQELVPLVQKLMLPTPSISVADLERTLIAARRAQPGILAQLNERTGQLGMLKERYHQASVVSWEPVAQRRQQHGDPATLPELMRDIRRDIAPVCQLLAVPVPQASLLDCEKALGLVRRAQPRRVGELQLKAGRLSELRERYKQVSQEAVVEVSISREIQHNFETTKARIDQLNRQIPALSGQLKRRQAIEQELAELRTQLQVLPRLREESDKIQQMMDALEIAGKRGKMYNQILTAGTDYLEQAQPDHCPLCKQSIADLCILLDGLRQEMPEDVEAMRQTYASHQKALIQAQERIGQLEKTQGQITSLEGERAAFPLNLETQLKEKQEENERLAGELAGLQAEITRIEGRVRLAAENRKRLNAVLKDIETELGQVATQDVLVALDRAVEATRRQAAEVGALDFQPISTGLEQAKQLDQIQVEEASLSQRLNRVVEEIGSALGQMPGEDVMGALETAIQVAKQGAEEVQILDFQSVASKLDLAKQLAAIQSEETQLSKRLDEVQREIERALGAILPTDLLQGLDAAIVDLRSQVTEIQGVDTQSVASELDNARQLFEIQKDERRLQEYQSGYRTARREKARLNHQIQRLTELRNALVDIAETTKRHQQSIVTGILNDLDIDRYYQRLAPHPAYCQLQIEPELTDKGTYEYWIKALTDDRARGTYVQTRFSTAQANCAAIAIFLAVNQHLSRRLETIILDDPSQSMDPAHQKRLVDTLATVPRQVIVATEDPKMLEVFSDAFDDSLIYELSPWTVHGTTIAS